MSIWPNHMPTHDIIRTRQARVSSEGYAFQAHVKDYVNQFLEEGNHTIRVLSENEVFGDNHLQDMFLIPVRGFKLVWGDVDLVVKNLETNHPIALISCKLSLHGRFSETLFYSMVYKAKIPDLRVVFVTPDKGAQASAQWRTEWGSTTRPTKDRFLAETYLDGVYIDNDYLRRTWGLEGNTIIGGKIRPISQLVPNLLEWNQI
jgi:hypothetical protein